MIKDKKGSAMVIWFLGLILVTLMFLAMQVGTTRIIYEKSKLYTIADEAADKAAEELYEYQTDPLKNNGNVDLNTGLQLAANKAVSVFAQYGLTLNNPTVHFDKGFLVVDGTVSTPYVNPTLTTRNADNISFIIEGRSLIRKVRGDD